VVGLGRGKLAVIGREVILPGDVSYTKKGILIIFTITQYYSNLCGNTYKTQKTLYFDCTGPLSVTYWCPADMGL
jgi:hypothetical protein